MTQTLLETEVDDTALPALDSDENSIANTDADRQTDREWNMATRLVAIDIPLRRIVAGDNPRDIFDESEIDDLAEDIRLNGLLHPITVRPLGTEYQIIVGERRFRAFQKLGTMDIPAFIREGDDDKTVLILGLAENLKRSELDAMQIARALHRLTDKHGMTQSEVGQSLGMHQSHVANYLRFLDLPISVQELVSRKQIKPSHAQELASISDVPAMCIALARRVVSDGLTTAAVRAEIRSFQAQQEALKPKSETLLDVPPSPKAFAGADPQPATQIPDAALAEQPDYVPSPVDQVRAEVGMDGLPDPLASVDSTSDTPDDDQASDDVDGEAKAASDAVDASAPVAEATTPPRLQPMTREAPPPAPKPTPPPAASASAKSDGRTVTISSETLAALQGENLTVDAAVAKLMALFKTPPLPPGWTNAMVKVADYERAREMGLWPLASAIEAYEDARAGIPEGVQLGDAAAKDAQKLAEWNLTGQVLDPAHVEVLHDLYPSRDETTAAMIADVLVVAKARRIEQFIEASQQGEQAAAEREARMQQYDALIDSGNAPSVDGAEEDE